VNGMNSGNPSGRESHGNPEPSRRYTGGRCRDYLRAGRPTDGPDYLSALNNRLEHPAPSRTLQCAGEEIVHSRRKRRGRVNPLVVGSNPTGPIAPPKKGEPLPQWLGIAVAAGSQQVGNQLRAHPARHEGELIVGAQLT
jgi:hypothetical protein